MPHLAAAQVRVFEVACPHQCSFETRVPKSGIPEIDVAQIQVMQIRAAEVGNDTSASPPGIPPLVPLVIGEQADEVRALAAESWVFQAIEIVVIEQAVSHHVQFVRQAPDGRNPGSPPQTASPSMPAPHRALDVHEFVWLHSGNLRRVPDAHLASKDP